ncbi:DUF6544 family protein [Ornithinimicrobium sp. LYQ121]|uniref:DUF6544 family protein n=1 Tax=Ornithinimicrobium sp. LYQ121 TaxID=3378801 RepID=UPI003851B391
MRVAVTMDRRGKTIIGGLTVAFVVLTSVIRVGRSTLERRINCEIRDVLGSGHGGTGDPVSEDHLVELPQPVQRWLRWSGAVGKPISSTVRLRQEGELRVGDLGWLPFTAEEYYSTSPPAFVWKATIRMAPGITVIGKDSYLNGRGALEMRVLGLVPVAQDTGPGMDQGDLLRYLNEIMWFPSGALIPQITWEPVDDESARATMTYGGVTGTATFFFDIDGRPTNMTADRHDRERGTVVPWSTPIHDYGQFDGVKVPTAGEALYAHENGDIPYIRARVTNVDHNASHQY